MSFRYQQIGLFRCDEWGCRETVLGYLGETPTGWTESKESKDPLDPTKDWITHRCQKHSTNVTIASHTHTDV